MEHRDGQHLGNYHLLRLLGQGGFAHVYLGEHAYLKTRAAIKVLRVQLSGEHEQDFLREAQTLAHLEHPHIVRVLDFGVQEGVPFLVMQYAPRGSLRKAHPKGTILSAITILPYLKDVASALQYAHDRKVVHRDVKPENTLIGQQQRILLSDFGLSVVSHSAPQQQQNVAGTVSYMAPEQLQGYPCAASDQYALGVVVYEWLCGVLPFTGSALEVATQHLMATPLPLREHHSALCATVEQVILTALAKRPDQRFADITAFVTAFEQATLADPPGHQLPGLSQRPLVSSRQIEHYQQHSLVGRAQERECLSRLLRETEQQRQQPEIEPSLRMFSTLPARAPSAFILGDAGIGKTRLAEELRREAQQSGWVVVQTRSYAQESHIPYRIWIDVLRSILTQGLWKSQEERLPSHLSQALSALLPELSGILSHENHPTTQPSKVEPFWIWEAVLMLLMAVCRQKPLLLLLDDLHWADTSSIELLGYLVRHLVNVPMLLAGTCREGDVLTNHALQRLLLELQRERLSLQLSLPPLTDMQIGMLVAHLPERLVTSIKQQAAGNPFFAEELARACLIQRGDTGNASVSSSPPSQVFPLPQTITGVLDQYLGKLSSRCQQLLRCAAVWEGSFSIATLSLMNARKNGPKGEEDMLLLLEEALEAKILLEEGSGSSIAYHFRHPLLQNRLYETISATRRATLHRQAAEALRTVYGNREVEGAVLITHHLVRGGVDPYVIADYAERAANYAYMLAAYPEAERHYRLALEQKKEHGAAIQKTQQVQAALTEEQSHQALLLEQLGECLRVQGLYEEARRCYEQALEIRSQCATPHKLQQERHLLAMLCVKIGQTWEDVRNLQQAQQCYELGEQVLQEAGSGKGTVMAFLRLRQSYTHWHQGSYETAYLLAQEAQTLFEQALEQPSSGGTRSAPLTQIQRILAGDPVNLGGTYIALSMTTAKLGRYNDALDHLNRALTIFEQYHCQRELAITCCDLGDLYLRRADYAWAQSLLQRSLSLAEHMGEVPLSAIVLLNLGLLQTRKGNLTEAEKALRRGITLIKSLNDPYATSLLYACLATALQEQGEVDKAGTVLRGALRISREAHMAPIIGVTLIALGQLRIEQAIGISDESDLLRTRLLLRAKNTLRRALTTPGLEAETRVEGQLALARVVFLEGSLEAAHQQAFATLEQARRLELLWLVPHAHCLLGAISAALGHDSQADQYFARARHGFRTRGMRLAYGRTLQQYGHFLRRRDRSGGRADRQGRLYLLKAREIFRECNARRDLQRLEQSLESPSDSSSQKLAVVK